MISTQTGTSHVGGSKSNSSVFSFSFTTPTVVYSSDYEWILDTSVTYHVCLNRDWFSNFEKLDGCSIVISDDRPCIMKRIGLVLIKIFYGKVRELKEVMYISQLKKNLISVGVLKALGLEISSRDVLKMLRVSMVVMKGVRRNNLYYLKDNKVTGK